MPRGCTQLRFPFYGESHPVLSTFSTEALRDEFPGALAALGDSAGNGRLRELLEWEEATYDAVKAELLSRGLMMSCQGRGGSVALADAEGASPQGILM